MYRYEIKSKEKQIWIAYKSKTVSMYVHMYTYVYAYGLQIAEEILCRVKSVYRIVAEFVVVESKY